MTWQPSSLPDRTKSQPVYEQLLHSLVVDIDEGLLSYGEQLPPQRKLATSLGVSVGTVTRLYREAEARGLIEGVVGSGTRVTRRSAAAASEDEARQLADVSDSLNSRIINLSKNEPANAISARAFEEAARHPDFLRRLSIETGYAPHSGHIAHRKLFSDWLGRNDTHVEWNQTVVCHGAHHAIALALRACTTPGQSVLVESNTYFGFLSIARALELTLVPISTDSDGPRMDSLEKAASENRGAVLYLMPSLQNPTLRTIPTNRRQEIVWLARASDMTIIEDDVYRALSPQRLEPFLHLAPERTLYLTSLSKVVAPALRAGCLSVFAPMLLDKVNRILQSDFIAGTSASMTLAASMIESGLVDNTRDKIVADSAARLEIVNEVLGSKVNYRAELGAHHIWVPMALERAEQVCFEAMQSSIALTPPSTVSLDSENAGIRISIGACEKQELRASLSMLRASLI